MQNIAIAEITMQRVVPQSVRDVSPSLRSAGRKARLSGISSDDPMAELLSALPAAIGRRLRFHEPAATQPSFDELWLENALDAIRQGDAPRYRFAMLSRMSREKASALHFLMCRAACKVDAV